jgi:hypothetical protein
VKLLNFNRTIFILGLVMIASALVHYLIVQEYGEVLIDMLKKYDVDTINNYIIQLVKYEALVGFLILSLSSGLMILKPKKE